MIRSTGHRDAHAERYPRPPTSRAPRSASPDADLETSWIAVTRRAATRRRQVILIVHALEDGAAPPRLQAELGRALAARDEALRAGQLKTRFLGMISHELRTPLTALSLQVERMQRNAADLPHRHQESLDRIAVPAARMREMIETLLEYARIEGGHLSVHVTPFDLVDSVRKTVAHHRHEAEQRGLRDPVVVARRAAVVTAISGWSSWSSQPGR